MLTNQDRGPYCELWMEFFPVDLCLKSGSNEKKKNGDPVSYGTDPENKVRKTLTKRNTRNFETSPFFNPEILTTLREDNI